MGFGINHRTKKWMSSDERKVWVAKMQTMPKGTRVLVGPAKAPRIVEKTDDIQIAVLVKRPGDLTHNPLQPYHPREVEIDQNPT